MSYRLLVRDDALADIERAGGWYEDQRPGLGADFVRTILDALDSLAANPLLYPLRDRQRQVHWFVAPRFPYRIFYRVTGDLITVFAVIHTARHDRHWKRRA